MTTPAANRVRTKPVQVLGVSMCPSDPALCGFSIDSPRDDEELEHFWLPLVGWVVPRQYTPVEIKVTHDGTPLQEMAASHPRPDIAAAFPDVPHARSSGFSAAISVARLPEDFVLLATARVGASTIEIATIAGRRRRFEPLASGRAPLTVTTLGRSGSTLVAALLSSHPAVVALDPARHDSRPFSYWLEVATSLARPGSHRRLVDSEPRGGDWWTGHETTAVETLHRIATPVRDWLGRTSVERLLHFGVTSAFEFIDQIARATDRRDARYALEKCAPTYLPRLVRELCPQAKELFLVRDFRDMLASMLAFNEKRGFAAFGRETVASDEEFLFRLKRDVERLVAAWRDRRDSSLLIRYEDVVDDPENVLVEVFSYLEVDISRDVIRNAINRGYSALLRADGRHQTSHSARDSVGRWQRDLRPSLRDLSTEVFGDLLTDCGYEAARE